MEKKEMKLKLNKETIANLDSLDMTNIRGGEDDELSILKICDQNKLSIILCPPKSKPIKMADDKCKVNKEGS
ncbi:class I lanthipeptide [Bacteroidota bacterium]